MRFVFVALEVFDVCEGRLETVFLPFCFVPRSIMDPSSLPPCYVVEHPCLLFDIFPFLSSTLFTYISCWGYAHYVKTKPASNSKHLSKFIKQSTEPNELDENKWQVTFANHDSGQWVLDWAQDAAEGDLTPERGGPLVRIPPVYVSLALICDTSW